MEITGIIKKIGDTQTFASGFQKREFILLTQETFPQPLMIELLQDKIDIIDPFKEGDEAIVGINLRGRQWSPPNGGEDKYFNSISAWKITRPTASQPQSSKVPQASTEQAFGNPFEDDVSEDLPF